MFLLIYLFFARLHVCSSTPWLRCGFRRHQRWTRVSSITAAHSWATCSTSETWCWGECEVTGDDVVSRRPQRFGPPSRFARVAPQVWLCQFQHQRREPEQDEPSPRSWCGESLRDFRKTSSAGLTLTSSGSLKMQNFWEEYHIHSYLCIKTFEFYSLHL